VFLFLLTTLALNLVFLMTYLVLHFNFRSLLTTSSEIETLKKGALFITSLLASSYFVCYAPTMVVYLIMCVEPRLISQIRAPYKLLLDYVLRLLPHLNSCILPLFLVAGKTLRRMKVAATVTHMSVRRHTDLNPAD
jgi:hypothetical protein